MTTQEAAEYECIILDKIMISRRHYNVLKELAALNEKDLSLFLKDELEFVIEDMAFNDPDHIAKLMARKWRKQLAKELLAVEVAEEAAAIRAWRAQA